MYTFYEAVSQNYNYCYVHYHTIVERITNDSTCPVQTENQMQGTVKGDHLM